MRFYFARPSGFLKAFVKDYCFMASDAGESDVQERVVPMESIQLMFHYGNPFVFCHEDHSVTLVRFFPAGACHFFRFPLYEIENRSLDLHDV